MSTTAMTLYAIEEHLAALLDTADMVESPEQQEAIAVEIQQALLHAVEKRDRAGQFLVHCETQQATIDAEIKRLRALKDCYARAQERMERYIQRTIEVLGVDHKGKYRKLEGKTCVFALRACPASTDVRDESVIPSAFKTLTITVPATAWEELIDNADIDERMRFLAAVRKTECAIDRKGIKAAIEGAMAEAEADTRSRGVTDLAEIQAAVDAVRASAVPGASLITGKYSVVRK